MLVNGAASSAPIGQDDEITLTQNDQPLLTFKNDMVSEDYSVIERVDGQKVHRIFNPPAMQMTLVEFWRLMGLQTCVFALKQALEIVAEGDVIVPFASDGTQEYFI